MNMVSVTNQSSFQKFHPLSLLAQVTSRKTTGCLRIFNGDTCWSLYLEQGDLIYATSSAHLFDRLDRNLRQLSRQVPTLVSAVRVQVRLLFENTLANPYQLSADYQAISWLVEQQYINYEQATYLIGNIAREVLESLLMLNEGSYEILEKEKLENWVKLCQFDLRSLTEYCQSQVQRYQVTGKAPDSFLPKVESPNQRIVPLKPELPTPQRSVAPSPDSATTQTVGFKKPDDRKPLNKKKYTVVCIDDSPTILKTIKSYLDDMSFTVVTIDDPLKALMQVIRNQPDIVLLDVGMPNLDGYDFCALLRRNPAFKATPVIMVTGNTGLIDRARAKLVGASGYLAKPFNQSDLLKIIFKHLA